MLIALKLLLAPFFIAVVSLAGRRWGSAVTGLLIGLPLTSGPISLLLALQYGKEFAADAARGNLAGQASTCVFCLVYALCAVRSNPLTSSLTALLAYFVVTFTWNQFSFTLLAAVVGILLTIVIVLRLMPRVDAAEKPFQPPAWDLPARMSAAVVFVLLLTTFARVLGPQLSGMLAPFPVFGLVLSVFAHRQQGGASAARLLRGQVLGSTAYTAFFVVVGTLLPVLPVALVYIIATLATIAANLAAFSVTRLSRRKVTP